MLWASIKWNELIPASGQPRLQSQRTPAMKAQQSQPPRRPCRLTIDVNFQSWLRQQKKKDETYGTRLARERGAVRSLLNEDLRMWTRIALSTVHPLTGQCRGHNRG